MKDLNTVSLVGRLTRDAELRYTNSGMPICNFSIANNYSKKQGDQWTEEVNFFDVVVFGRQGEAVNNYLKKGKQVAVQGELRQDRWEQDGQRRSKVQVIASNLQLLGGRAEGGGGSGGQYGGGQYSGGGGSEPRNTESPPAPGPDFEDDVPF